MEILVLSRGVVGSHNPDLESRSDSAGEDTSESVESSFVGCGYHFGDVHHKGSLPGIHVSRTFVAVINRKVQFKIPITSF